MASSSKRIPPELWEQHKDTILGLRFGEKLPLDVSKSNPRNIVQVMKDDYQFEAKSWQYEEQLKKWSFGKNLKRKDWETILPVYSDLEKRGLKPRVRLGDQILDERKVKKARSRYLKPGNSEIEESIKLLESSAQTRMWHLEICQGSQYIEYSAELREPRPPEIPTSVPLPCDDVDNFLSMAGGQSTQDDPAVTLPQPRGNAPSSQLIISRPSLSPTRADSETFGQLSNFFLEEGDLLDISQELLFPDFGRIGLPSPGRSAMYTSTRDSTMGELAAQWTGVEQIGPGSCRIFQENPCLSPNIWAQLSRTTNDPYNYIRPSTPGQYEPQLILSKDSIDFRLQRIFKDPSFRLSVDVESVSAQDILDSLYSLIYDYSHGGEMPRNSSLVSGMATSTIEMFKRVILSIANNFSGLAGIPRGVVFGMLKNFSGANLDFLRSCLRSRNLSFSKPLADNMFRAAVEAGDEEWVSIILDTTSGQENRVDVNRIVCELGAERFTALALASYLHRPAMVQKLLEHGAKVCPLAGKSREQGLHNCALTTLYEQYLSDEHIEMRYFRAKRDRNPPQNAKEAVEIVRSLLDHELGTVACLLATAYHFATNNSQLLEILAQAVPAEHHAQIFEPPDYEDGLLGNCRRGVWRLGCIVEQLEPHVANQIIRSLMADCQTMGCTPSCAVKNCESLSNLVNLAILRLNFELAELFLADSQPDQGNLAAAIRCRRQPDMVDSMLEQGAISRGETPCANNMSHSYSAMRNRNGYCCSKPTTPLAEAIRWKNLDLIRRLEEYGALDRISDAYPHDLTAAVFATVEVGDRRYLEQLLALSSAQALNFPEDPIVEAIESGHFEMAIALITHLARHSGGIGNTSDVVVAALKTRNGKLVQKMTELSGFSYGNKLVLIEAVRWGDKNIIEVFLELVDDDALDEALDVAVANTNCEMAALLLDRGAWPTIADVVGVDDANLLNLLLRYGADPANERAFSLALQSLNTPLLAILVEAFTARYPNGKRCFGGVCLTETINARNSAALDVLLKLKCDVNSWAEGAPALIQATKSCGKNDLEATEMVCRLVKAGANLEARDRQGLTALLIAIKCNNLQLVNSFLEHGSKFDRPAEWGFRRTPLQQACETGRFEMVEFLVARGATINAAPATNGGATALQLAAISGNTRIVEFLLDEGAEIHAAPALIHGRTALEGAAEHGRISVLEILLRRGAAGYSKDDIAKAKSYAENENQRGCEERLKQALFRAAASTVGNGLIRL